MSFQEFVKANTQTAVQVLQARGKFSPQAVLCDDDNNISLAMISVDKKLWNGLMRQVVQKFKAKYVLLIDEVWVYDGPKKERILPISKNPFRKEALALTAYSKTGEQSFTLIPFERVDPKTTKLGTPRQDDEFESTIFQNPFLHV